MVHQWDLPLFFIFFSTIRERLELSDVPEFFKGNPIALVVAAIMSMAFTAFAGSYLMFRILAAILICWRIDWHLYLGLFK